MTSVTLIILCTFTLLIFPCRIEAGSKMTADRQDNTITTFVADNLAAGKPANLLLNEKSPYLLQHAFNPVQWHPWGEAALARARAENKPIFLSIGYSTCHWCHVMAHESFEDQAIADFLNQHFIAIKVDREERPDLDQIYMAATQALSGGGGWPMSVFLTPTLEPFYGGTYFPPTSRQGMPGFLDILQAIHNAWETDRANLVAAASRLTSHLQENANQEPLALEKGLSNQAMEQIASQYDQVHGGFGKAPKFPRPVLFNFMLRHHLESGDQRGRRMTLETLRRMAAGGIHDQIGGGFHRYAVDGNWRVPHFEKMLYDQAQLAMSYLEAYQLSNDPFFAGIARQTFDYVLRDLTSDEGGFYSAEDADSPDPDQPDHKREGAYYVWTAAETEKILGPKLAAACNHHFGVQIRGNVAIDPHGDFQGRNILYLAHDLPATSTALKMAPATVADAIAEGRRKLFAARSLRPHPHLDDKIITGWNGMMISALAKGGLVLDEPRYLAAAERNAAFLADQLYDQQHRTLLRRFRSGEAGLPGLLDDHALLTQGLIDLYEASFNIRWLKWAVELTEQQIRLFADEARGGFFETPAGDSSLLLRVKGDYDGAEPAANSIAALNLLRLGQLLDRPEWQKRGVATMAAFGVRIKSYPPLMPQMLAAQLFQREKPLQVVIAGRAEDADTRAMQRALAGRFLPHKTMLLADGSAGQEYLARHRPDLADLKPTGDRATAYVCRGYSCQQPTTDPGKLLELLVAPEKTAGRN